jgi:hypothetical protein
MKTGLTIFALLILMMATGCSLSVIATPTPLPPQFVVVQTSIESTPTVAPTVAPTASSISTAVSQTSSTSGVVINSGNPSGPYAVVLVLPNDSLNIRSGPGVANPIVSSFPPTTINIMRTGRYATVGNAPWVEVNRPDGGTGWVNGLFLTEHVDPSAVCSDQRAIDLISKLKTALTTKDGNLLSSLISPVHGTDVRYIRSGTAANYNGEEAKWVFVSTYEINWGQASGSGLDVKGPFHVVVLPKLLDTLNAGYSVYCNDATKAGAVSQPWPPEYANVPFFAIYKPGSPGVDLDWRTWLMGVEYVNGQPYIFALIHFEWAP